MATSRTSPARRAETHRRERDFPGAGKPAGPDGLAGLDELPSTGVWSIFGRRLRVTNLDKVLFPARPGEDPVTKRDLLRYTALVARTR